MPCSSGAVARPQPRGWGSRTDRTGVRSANQGGVAWACRATTPGGSFGPQRGIRKVHFGFRGLSRVDASAGQAGGGDHQSSPLSFCPRKPHDPRHTSAGYQPSFVLFLSVFAWVSTENSKPQHVAHITPSSPHRGELPTDFHRDKAVFPQQLPSRSDTRAVGGARPPPRPPPTSLHDPCFWGHGGVELLVHSGTNAR